MIHITNLTTTLYSEGGNYNIIEGVNPHYRIQNKIFLHQE